MRKISVWRALRTFGRSERGSVMVYVALTMPVFLGLAVLAIDVGRVQNLNTGLQKGADALALAGAAELDRRSDSITRANSAIANLVTNNSNFSTAGQTAVTVASKTYYSVLPPKDLSALSSGTATTDPTLAHYVAVTVNTQTLNTLFPISLLGGTNSSTTSATAVAGFDSAVCRFTPMFICNPWEGTSTAITDALKDPTQLRRQIKLQAGNGGSSQYFPGNYGWLSSPTLGNGANALRDALAQVQPTACFDQNGVTVQTGNITSANDALNTRFDLWTGPYISQSGNASYRPAQNVRKGYVAGKGKNAACNAAATSPNTNKFGQDSAFPGAGGRLGNGVWDFNTYWTTNFGTTAIPPGWSNANLPSRYQVYQYENGPSGLTKYKSAIGEVGTPQCYSGGGLSPTPDRRLLYVAVIDCNNLSVHGNSSGALPVTAFAKVFITEPIPLSPAPDAGTIYGELSGIVLPGDADGVDHDIVQLYR